MTTNATNGHPLPEIPLKPPVDLPPRPLLRRLVTEVYYVGVGGKEETEEFVEPTSADLTEWLRERGHVVHPCGRCGGSTLDPEHDGSCGECQEVVGTTPSGEAVRMVNGDDVLKGAPVPPGREMVTCGQCGWGYQLGGQCGNPVHYAPLPKEEPVRMVGAERAEVERAGITVGTLCKKHADAWEASGCEIDPDCPDCNLRPEVGKMPSAETRLGFFITLALRHLTRDQLETSAMDAGALARMADVRPLDDSYAAQWARFLLRSET